MQDSFNSNDTTDDYYVDPSYFASDYLTFTKAFVLTAAYNRTFSDTTLLADVLALSYGKSFSDSNVVADSSAFAMGKGLSDTITISSSGYTFLNDYIDNTYFASDYVGTITTFS